MNVDKGSRHPSPYEDVMDWALINYARLLAKVQSDITNEKARHDWVATADKELMALHEKWGKS
jgi:hypothetical protein